MRMSISSFNHGESIPGKYAFCIPAEEGHVQLSENINPHVLWSDLPEEAKSLVLICHDPDVPAIGDDVNQEGKILPVDLPRTDFYHWVLANIPVTLTELPEGTLSSGITTRGKTPGKCEFGKQGIITATQAGLPEMRTWKVLTVATMGRVRPGTIPVCIIIILRCLLLMLRNLS